MKKLTQKQEDALDILDLVPTLGVAYKPGCGKTMIYLAWIYKLFQKDEIQDALVICPAALIESWKVAIDKMVEFEGFTPSGVKKVKDNTFITSYQKTYKMVKENHKRRNGQEWSKKTYILRPDVDKAWGAICVDESHGIGAHNSIQTKSCLKLADHTERRVILTGTPVSGGGSKRDNKTGKLIGGADYQKLYGQLMFLDPGKWKNWTEWKGKYVIADDFWGKPMIYDESKCKRLLEEYFVFATLEDVMTVTESIDDEIFCPLEQKKMYKDIGTMTNLDKYGVDITVAGSEYTKLHQICSGSLKRTEDTLIFETSKDPALKTLLEGTDDKVVIFCRLTASVDRVARICEGYGETVIFDGRSKTATWKDFQFGTARYIVCQYDKGNAGIDLFSSHTMVFYECTLSARVLEQARARIQRKGQTQNCLYHFLITPKTVESKTWEQVRKGYEVTNDMMTRWSRGEIGL